MLVEAPFTECILWRRLFKRDVDAQCQLRLEGGRMSLPFVTQQAIALEIFAYSVSPTLSLEEVLVIGVFEYLNP